MKEQGRRGAPPASRRAGCDFAASTLFLSPYRVPVTSRRSVTSGTRWVYRLSGGAVEHTRNSRSAGQITATATVPGSGLVARLRRLVCGAASRRPAAEGFSPSTVQVPPEASRRGQVARAPALAGLEELAVHGVAVLGALDGPEDPDGRGLVGAPGQAAQLEGEPGLVPALVVDEQGVLAHLRHLGDPQAAVGLHDHPVLLLGAEADGLAVDEGDEVVGAGVAAGDLLEGAVVEDVAVLVDLDEGGALVVVRPAEDLLHVLAVHVVGPGHEARLGAEGEADGVEAASRGSRTASTW